MHIFVFSSLLFSSLLFSFLWRPCSISILHYPPHHRTLDPTVQGLLLVTYTMIPSVVCTLTRRCKKVSSISHLRWRRRLYLPRRIIAIKKIHPLLPSSYLHLPLYLPLLYRLLHLILLYVDPTLPVARPRNQIWRYLRH